MYLQKLEGERISKVVTKHAWY